ncbi:MAG: hypothetical protein ACLQDV_07025 [Candidatus Binataceae bacterium]
MNKNTKRQQLIHIGFEIHDDAQRAKAEARARKCWSDDNDIVVDRAFETQLRTAIERLRKRVDVPSELLYKNVIRARIVHARDEFNKKRPAMEKALVAAQALCSTMEALGAPPNVYWSDHRDVTLFRKVIDDLPNLQRLRDDLRALAAQFGKFKRRPGRPRDYEKATFQLLMVSLLPDRVQQSGRRMDKEFAELYEMVSGRKQNPESYNRIRRATATRAAKILRTIAR